MISLSKSRGLDNIRFDRTPKTPARAFYILKILAKEGTLSIYRIHKIMTDEKVKIVYARVRDYIDLLQKVGCIENYPSKRRAKLCKITPFGIMLGWCLTVDGRKMVGDRIFFTALLDDLALPRELCLEDSEVLLKHINDIMIAAINLEWHERMIRIKNNLPNETGLFLQKEMIRNMILEVLLGTETNSLIIKLKMLNKVDLESIRKMIQSRITIEIEGRKHLDAQIQNCRQIDQYISRLIDSNL